MLKLFEERRYRNIVLPSGLVSFNVRVKETDLLVSASGDFYSGALSHVKAARRELEGYGRENPGFLESLSPVDAADGAPAIVGEMCRVSKLCGVGPMAAVAGAVAERVGMELRNKSKDVIVENGGDVFLASGSTRMVGIYAGASPLSARFALEILPEQTPCGVCSSSGTVGHSLNFGAADAVVVCSPSAALADAAATACSNLVHDEASAGEAVEFARSIPGVQGIVVIIGCAFAAWGAIRIREM